MFKQSLLDIEKEINNILDLLGSKQISSNAVKSKEDCTVNDLLILLKNKCNLRNALDLETYYLKNKILIEKLLKLLIKCRSYLENEDNINLELSTEEYNLLYDSYKTLSELKECERSVIMILLDIVDKRPLQNNLGV